MAKCFIDESYVEGLLITNRQFSVNKKSFEYQSVSKFAKADELQCAIVCDNIREQQAMEKAIENIIVHCFNAKDMLVFQKTDKDNDLFALIVCKPGSNAWDSYMSRNKVKKSWSEVKEAYNG